MRFIIVAVLALSGCATSYQSRSFTGGFEEVALAPNVYRVSFRGNGYTSGIRAEEMALLRSADLTLQKGFRYFALAGSDTSSTLSSYTTPVTTTTTANVTAYGTTAYGTAQTTSYGGDTVFISKPRSTNVVVMFADRPDVNGMVFDAQFLCGSLGEKYEAVCGVR